MKLRSLVLFVVSAGSLACGDVTISAPIANECLEACRAEEVCVAGLCVPADSVPAGDAGVASGTDAGPGSTADGGTTQPVDAGTTPPVGGDGSSRDSAAVSCQALLAAFPNTSSDTFFIDPDLSLIHI